MKLTRDEMVRSKDASPLELFEQGIRAEETRDKYTRTLRQVTCDVLEDILEGAFEERVAQLVKYGREDPEWTRDLLLNLSGKLRKRTELPRDHPDYLNPSSLNNYFKPIKKLFDMNDVVMPWKRVYATFPEMDNMAESRGWTRGEIGKMIRHAHDPMERALVLVLASSGIRSGGLDLNWGDLVPIYRVRGGLVLDPGAEDGEVACAMLQVYRGSSESYVTFVTPEAYRALREYGRMWERLMGRQPRPKDPVFLVTQGAPRRASYRSVRKRVDRMIEDAGLREGGAAGARRNEVPLMNGFRRYWNKTCKESLSADSPLSSLIKKEFMMGHKGLVSLDQNYFKTSVLELAEEYAGIVPDLTIDDAERLRRSNRRMSVNIRELEEKNARIEELERKVEGVDALRRSNERMAKEMRKLEEKNARIEELERKVDEAERLRVQALDANALLGEAARTGRAATAEDANLLNDVLASLERIHRQNIEEALASRDREMAELKAKMAKLSKREESRGGEPAVHVTADDVIDMSNHHPYHPDD